MAELLERGIRVVDLSADFRLRELATYERWYGEHPAPHLIAEAVYGLPERYREQIRGARLVATPGCYPTAAILLAPLVGRLADVVIDAKSGSRAPGARPSPQALRIGGRDRDAVQGRRAPALARDRAGARRARDVHAAPRAALARRAVSCYVRTDGDVDARALYRDAYADEPWVEVVEARRA